ncbi:hypothetical protein V500_02773 [Pseudogymnoascus sp. VKM F-4518 (FW-2643)]|nr:hypothetical protein V500_02773 [Pseudogymnoascus sp. VKM F-4518 (FW-2643)]
MSSELEALRKQLRAAQQREADARQMRNNVNKKQNDSVKKSNGSAKIHSNGLRFQQSESACDCQADSSPTQPTFHDVHRPFHAIAI